MGRVAEEQRQWAQAEQYYQQALAIKIEYNDRYSQASTYHQFSAERSVEARDLPGGPARKAVDRALREAREQVDALAAELAAEEPV